MKLRILWIAGAVLAFVIFFLAALPATQVLGRIDLPDNVNISGVSGSFWNGKARQVVANGIPVDNVSWSVSPWGLLVGSMNVMLKGGEFRNADAVAFEGPMHFNLFSPGHVETDGFLLFLPVDRVLARVPLPLPVNAGGRFRVRLEQMEFGPTCDSLSGFGDWLNATVAGTQGPIDFGNYTAKLSCEGEAIGVSVLEPNLLGLSMNAVVSPNFKSIDVEGRFKPDDSLPDEVHQAARFFGQPGADGYFPIKL